MVEPGMDNRRQVAHEGQIDPALPLKQKQLGSCNTYPRRLRMTMAVSVLRAMARAMLPKIFFLR